jgi:hypothetical protein
MDAMTKVVRVQTKPDAAVELFERSEFGALGNDLENVVSSCERRGRAPRSPSVPFVPS